MAYRNELDPTVDDDRLRSIEARNLAGNASPDDVAWLIGTVRMLAVELEEASGAVRREQARIVFGLLRHTTPVGTDRDDPVPVGTSHY